MTYYAYILISISLMTTWTWKKPKNSSMAKNIDDFEYTTRNTDNGKGNFFWGGAYGVLPRNRLSLV
jgi:hypothetical protein